MIADVFNISDFRNMKINNFTKEVEEVKVESNDKVFDEYKNQHISEAISQITRDLERFTASNKAAKFQK